MLISLCLIIPSCANQIIWDKLRTPTARKLSSNTPTNVIAVLAIPLYLLPQLFFVRSLDCARVDLISSPAMLIGTEAFSKTTCILGRVAEDKPDDFRFFISERSRYAIPYYVSNRASLIEYYYDPLALVVQSAEGIGVLCIPRNQIGAPGVSVLHIPHGDALRFYVEPVGVQRESIPFGKFGMQL